MTEAEWTTVEEYFRCAADWMGLKDWKITIKREATAGDGEWEYGGTIETIHGRKMATIKLHETFRDLDPEEQRRIVIHELIHAHFAGAETVVNNLAVKAGWLTESQRDAQYAAYLQMHEYGVDGIATAWADSFGLIEWPEEEPKKKK